MAVGPVAGRAPSPAKGAEGAAPTRSSRRLEDPDDVSLARKVETEIFRPADAPKGDVSVDVQDGVALPARHGRTRSGSRRLDEDAADVDGVKGVENLLHAPGTAAPQQP